MRRVTADRVLGPRCEATHERAPRGDGGGVSAYLYVPWRSEPLTTAERVENIARARHVISTATDPSHPDHAEAKAHSVWAFVALEYEDLLRELGHGLPGEDEVPL